MGLVVTFMTNITNPLAILSCLMIGIAPWLGKALLGIGGSLLKGIFGGKAKKQERKQRFKTYERLRESRRPDKPYSRGVDPVVQRAIENIFTSRGLQNPYATGATGGTGQISQANQPQRVTGQLGGGRSPRSRNRRRV